MQREVMAPLPFKIWSNVGETRNTGVELSITSRNFVGPKFQWSTTLAFSTNKEEVIKNNQRRPASVRRLLPDSR